MFKNLYSVYVVVMVSVLLMLSGQAHATPVAPFWVGTGVFEASSANSSVVTYHPYRTPNMNTDQDCINYLADAQALVLSKNVKGNALQHKIHAVCAQVNSVQ